jgi:hypothetical protein
VVTSSARSTMNRPHSLQPTQSIGSPLRDAFSLLEVVAGLTVITLILVPTTRLMRDVLVGEGVQRQRSELIHLAQGKQHEQCHMVRANFRATNEVGNFAAQGFPDLAYQIRCQPDPALGGIPDRLMAIHTMAWHDANRNTRLDVGETSISLWTSVARATP